MLLMGCTKCNVRMKPSIKSKWHGKKHEILTLQGKSKFEVRMKQSIKIGDLVWIAMCT